LDLNIQPSSSPQIFDGIQRPGKPVQEEEQQPAFNPNSSYGSLEEIDDALSGLRNVYGDDGIGSTNQTNQDPDISGNEVYSN
jgi:hypothetical protein